MMHDDKCPISHGTNPRLGDLGMGKLYTLSGKKKISFLIIILPLMLLGNHYPTGIFPILRPLVYVSHQGPLAGVELTTFGLRETIATVRPRDEDIYMNVLHSSEHLDVIYCCFN